MGGNEQPPGRQRIVSQWCRLDFTTAQMHQEEERAQAVLAPHRQEENLMQIVAEMARSHSVAVTQQVRIRDRVL